MIAWRRSSTPRRKVTIARSPIRSPVRSLCRTSIAGVATPSRASRMSPSARPARTAGLPGSRPATRTPVSWERRWCRMSLRRSGAFWPATPMKLRRMRPSFISQAATQRAVLLAMAKQIPCAGRMIAVLTPMT
ncbi:MAG TPA: hypothetical protein VN877_02795 [Opitutaceae bacterium]|nr:hypothetical protein [Opitutaceae bacterium]